MNASNQRVRYVQIGFLANDNATVSVADTYSTKQMTIVDQQRLKSAAVPSGSSMWLTHRIIHISDIAPVVLATCGVYGQNSQHGFFLAEQRSLMVCQRVASIQQKTIMLCNAHLAATRLAGGPSAARAMQACGAGLNWIPNSGQIRSLSYAAQAPPPVIPLEEHTCPLNWYPLVSAFASMLSLELRYIGQFCNLSCNTPPAPLHTSSLTYHSGDLVHSSWY